MFGSNQFQVFVSRKIIDDTNLSNDAFTVYVGLQMMIREKEYSYLVCPETLKCILADEDIFNENKLLFIKRGMEELIKKKYIKIIRKLTNHYGGLYHIDLSSIYGANIPFVKVNVSDIHKIFSSSVKVKQGLFRYYCKILSLIGNNSYCQASFEDINKDIHLGSVPTMIRWNEILGQNDLGLLYISHRNGFAQRKNNTSTPLPNRYYKPEYKIEAILWRSKLNTNIHHDGQGSKLHPNSVLKKYDWFVNGKEYSYDELKDMYHSLVLYNHDVIKKNKKYRDENRPESWQKKIKDLTVFKEYDFYDLEDLIFD
jgi:hypothetical protein